MGILGTITRGLIDDPGRIVQPGVTISPKNSSLFAGINQQLFTAALVGGLIPPVTWTLTGAGSLVVAGDTLSATYVPPETVDGQASASLTIQVGTKTDVAAINVYPPPPATLTISPKNSSVFAGSAKLFAASLRNTTGQISWTLSGPGSLSTNIGAQVIYVAPAVALANQSVTVSAEAAGLSDIALLTVLPNQVLPLDVPHGGRAEVDVPLQGEIGYAVRDPDLSPVAPSGAASDVPPPPLAGSTGAASVVTESALEVPKGKAEADSSVPLPTPIGQATPT